ncbi:MAG TPA: hypothetical protein DHV31_01665 [Clostridiales bacterium]|nr:hypothetical protein [Clostridiales bacterium]
MKTLFLYILCDPTAEDDPIAGLTPVEWLMLGAGSIPYRVIEREEQALPVAEYDYHALLLPTTPLVTEKDLLTLTEEMDRHGIDGVQLGGGRVQKTQAFAARKQPKRRCAAPFALEIKTRAERYKAEQVLFRKNAEKCAQNGAIIPDVDSVRIDALSVLEEGAVIEPYASVMGSKIRGGARIGAFSEVENAEVCAGATITRSVVKSSVIGAGTTVGPFAYIRMNSMIGAGCRVGDFVEIKNSRLHDGVKAAHLAYIGDAEVGERTNVGCGTVFANYDGKKKHRTVVGKEVFIGANSNLVAPLSIGNGAFIAAATTVTKDVSEKAFVIGRVREEQKKRE